MNGVIFMKRSTTAKRHVPCLYVLFMKLHAAVTSVLQSPELDLHSHSDNEIEFHNKFMHIAQRQTSNAFNK